MYAKGRVYLLLVLLGNGLFLKGGDHIRPPGFDLIREFPYLYTLHQDQTGYLWIGTSQGLVRYDGYAFKYYQQDPRDPDSLSHNFVVDIAEDPEGNLWIAAFGGGLNFLNTTTGTFRHWPEEPDRQNTLPTNRIQRLWYGTEGQIWIGSADGKLIRFAPQDQIFATFSLMPDNSSRSHEIAVTDILQDPDGIIWITTRGDGLKRFNPSTGSLATYHTEIKAPRGDVPGEVFNCLYLDDKGSIWIGTNGKGIQKFDPRTAVFQQYAIDPSHVRLHTHNDVTGIQPIDDRLLISTNGGGLYWFHPERKSFRKFPAGGYGERSLALNYVQNIQPGTGGNIWMALMNGNLVRYNRNHECFANYLVLKKKQHYHQVRSLCLLEDPDGYLWVGTDGEGLVKYHRKHGHIATFEHDPENPRTIPSNYITNLWAGPGNRIWVCTWGGGLACLNPDTGDFHRYGFAPDNPGNSLKNTITTIWPKSTDGFWLGTLDGVYFFHRHTGEFTPFYLNSGRSRLLSDNVVYALRVDSRENLWIGGQKGLTRYDKTTATFTDISGKDTAGPGLRFIRSIYEDRDRNLWIGTQEEGLYRLSPPLFTPTRIQNPNGLPGHTVLGIQQDYSGDLWISTRRGLCRMDPESGACQVYRKGDGLAANLFTKAAIACRDGELLFGHINGISGFCPDDLRQSTVNENTVITDVRLLSADQRDFTFNRNRNPLVFRYDDSFTVSFSNLSFQDPGRTHYQYRVAGLTEKWIDLGNDNRITFSHLKPGNYCVTVRAGDPGSEDLEGSASLHLRITPPFWGSLYFKIFLIGMIGLLILLFYRFRMNRLKSLMTRRHRLEIFCRENNISDREMDIIQLILQGKSNRDIEDSLFISLNTVKNHLYNIYQKLGTDNRHQLMARINREISESPGRRA